MSKLIDFLETNAIDFQDQNNSVILACPTCQKNKLYIHKDELNFICFSCASSDNEAKGPHASKILEVITGIPAATIRSKLSDFTSISEWRAPTEDPVKIVQTPTAFQFPPNFYRITTNAALPGLAYLKGRGIPKDLAIAMDIRYSVDHESVIFPIYHDNIIVGYQGRNINPKCPKEYQKLTMRGLKKSQHLMFAQTINSDKVILAEGPISALKFAQSGIPYVATMGKYVSESQMSYLLSKGVRTILLALDPDAISETEALMKKYQSQFQFKLVSLTEAAKARINNSKADFGDCFFEECNDAIKDATPWHPQIMALNKIIRGFNASTR